MRRGTMLGLGWLVLAGGLLFAADPAAPLTPVIEFTAEERAWMAAHPVIRVGHDVTYEPYAILERNGSIVGIDPDFLQIFARRTGLKFENQRRQDWPAMLDAFRAHEVDLLLSLGLAPEREQFLIYTDTYALAPNVIVTRNDVPYMFSLDELKGKRISIPRGYTGLREDLAQSAPGGVIVEYENSLACYQAVANGEVYAATGNIANAAYLIRANQLTSLRLGSVIFARAEMYMGVRKDWPMLARILNKVLASITSEERQRIHSRWIMLDYGTDRRWALAFRVAAGFAIAAVAVFLLVFFHNRRLARELTERRRIQAELELVRDKLEQASAEKSEFMHMVAHDLRGPLTGIQLGAELLQLEPPLSGDELKSTAGRIRESVGKMARLINDLLSAQNVEEGHFTLNNSTGDAVQLVHAALAAVRPSAQKKRIRLEATLPGEAVELTTDFVALQQVVDNLLSNALKYSPVGSAVDVVLIATATHCCIEVRDQGPGVKPEEREKIFEKFGRGSARPTQGEESIGLGLWIVRRFMEALHGRVWHEPQPEGPGSVFMVEVPRTPPVIG